MARLDLGTSLQLDLPTTQAISERIGATVRLALSAMALALAISFPLGILAALRQDSPIDRFVSVLSLLGQSVPSFWLGIMFILLFARQLQWLPSAGDGTPSHLIMPALTLALTIATVLARTLRNSILEILQSDYVRTARAKGASWRRVIVRHILRNALISYLTLLGIALAWVIGGTVVIEQVYGVPGIGSLLINSILNRDYDLIQNNILVYALFVVLINLAVDLTYPVVDPRVRND